ncbi:unnamed protein product [Heterotrigona itama]|uniref:Odorant receptor n=1 Tax=Heterotrigona itama TaxID=395501 RepID=A0A6V7H0J1_9HYME|nr:unnamed protein product [Heterotrigona itama]
MTIFQEWENSNTASVITYLVLQMTTIIDTFTNCYVGQLLIDEGNIVKKISNTLDWYQLPVKKARYLIIVIAISNNPMKVTAANIIQLSLITFTNFLDDLRNDWLNATEEDQWIYKARATNGHRLMMSFMILLHTGGTSLRTITPFLRDKIILPNNTTIRFLPCSGYFFFNEQLSPNYEIIFFTQSSADSSITRHYLEFSDFARYFVYTRAAC